MKTFSFFYAFIFELKKSKPVEYIYTYKNNDNVFANWEKYKVSWNFYFVFVIDL